MLKKDLNFRAMYEKAIEDRADRLAEEILELADEPMPVHLEGPMASAWVQQKRMQVDARKWVASKLKPKKYGDFQRTESSVEMRVTNASDLTDDELAAIASGSSR